MSRTGLNFLVDVALLLVFTALIWTSIVLRFVFPSPAASYGWSLWGLSCNDWFQVQFGLLAAMMLVVLLHVMLHWSWVCGVVVNRLRREKAAARQLDDGTRTLWGVGLLIGLLVGVGVLTAAAALSIQPPP